MIEPGGAKPIVLVKNVYHKTPLSSMILYLLSTIGVLALGGGLWLGMSLRSSEAIQPPSRGLEASPPISVPISPVPNSSFPNGINLGDPRP